MNKQIFKIDSRVLMGVVNSQTLKVDDEIKQGVIDKLKNIIFNDNEDDIDLDYADLRCVVDGSENLYVMNLLVDVSKNLYEQIVDDEIINHKCKDILLSFKAHPDMPSINTAKIVDILIEKIDEDATCIFGNTTDKNMQKDKIEVMVISTSLEG